MSLFTSGIQCPECKQRFSQNTALCENWKDPDKSFGCPHCGTFFKSEENRPVMFLLPLFCFLGGVLGYFLGQKLTAGVESPWVLFAIIIGFTTIAGIGALIWIKRVTSQRELVLSGYKVDVSSQP